MHQTVPKAPNVAGLSHHLVPGPSGQREGLSSALTCPHTGATCAALHALFGSLAPAGDAARAWVQALAPCNACRVASQSGRDTLRHLRLGQREREILLAASAGAFAVTQPGMSRSLSAARRRAALSLGKAGLVAPVAMPQADGSQGTQRASSRATVALTDLGLYVMAAYGRYIQAGKPIRWTRPARGVPLPGQDPSDLIEETAARTQTALRETLDDLKGVLIAAVARPLKNPGLLDSVTRHLEQKATVLKAVLEPRRDRALARGAL